MSRDDIRFHLDEHVAHAIAHGLRSFGIDVTTTSDLRLIGADDNDQLAVATTQGRVLVTADDDLLRIATTTSHAGIAFFIVEKMSIARVVRALQLIHGVFDAREMHNKIEHLGRLT